MPNPVKIVFALVPAPPSASCSRFASSEAAARDSSLAPAFRTSAQAAAAEAAALKAASQVAYGGTMDGSVIYTQLCAGCHTSGAGGAPTLTAAGMGARASKGIDLLHKHAIEGFQGSAGVMPPKGGNPSLTDDQVKATVDWMMANLK
jgi:cytochrome c5